MGKVSVIIPVYGVETLIERCARHLFEQTLDEIEYLFIDDCTPDKSIEVLKQVLEDYPQRKPQVTIHRMEQNSGQAKVREWGMKHASGEYLIHCDSDDWPEKNQYELMYNAAKVENADLVFCDFYRYYTNGEKELVQRQLDFKTKYDLIGKILGGYQGVNQLWACLVSHRLIQGLCFPEGNQGEDQAMVIQFIYYSKHILHIDKPLYNYYINPGSLVRATSPAKLIKKTTDSAKNVELVIKFLEKERIIELYEEQIVSYKFSPKIILSIGLYNSKCRQLWYAIFPDIDGKILKNRFIGNASKFKEIIMRFKLGSIYGSMYFFFKYILRIIN